MEDVFKIRKLSAKARAVFAFADAGDARCPSIALSLLHLPSSTFCPNQTKNNNNSPSRATGLLKIKAKVATMVGPAAQQLSGILRNSAVETNETGSSASYDYESQSCDSSSLLYSGDDDSALSPYADLTALPGIGATAKDLDRLIDGYLDDGLTKYINEGTMQFLTGASARSSSSTMDDETDVLGEYAREESTVEREGGDNDEKKSLDPQARTHDVADDDAVKVRKLGMTSALKFTVKKKGNMSESSDENVAVEIVSKPAPTTVSKEVHDVAKKQGQLIDNNAGATLAVKALASSLKPSSFKVHESASIRSETDSFEMMLDGFANEEDKILFGTVDKGAVGTVNLLERVPILRKPSTMPKQNKANNLRVTFAEPAVQMSPELHEDENKNLIKKISMKLASSKNLETTSSHESLTDLLNSDSFNNRLQNAVTASLASTDQATQISEHPEVVSKPLISRSPLQPENRGILKKVQKVAAKKLGKAGITSKPLVVSSAVTKVKHHDDSKKVEDKLQELVEIPADSSSYKEYSSNENVLPCMISSPADHMLTLLSDISAAERPAETKEPTTSTQTLRERARLRQRRQDFDSKAGRSKPRVSMLKNKSKLLRNTDSRVRCERGDDGSEFEVQLFSRDEATLNKEDSGTEQSTTISASISSKHHELQPRETKIKFQEQLSPVLKQRIARIHGGEASGNTSSSSLVPKAEAEAQQDTTVDYGPIEQVLSLVSLYDSEGNKVDKSGEITGRSNSYPSVWASKSPLARQRRSNMPVKVGVFAESIETQTGKLPDFVSPLPRQYRSKVPVNVGISAESSETQAGKLPDVASPPAQQDLPPMPVKVGICAESIETQAEKLADVCEDHGEERTSDVNDTKIPFGVTKEQTPFRSFIAATKGTKFIGKSKDETKTEASSEKRMETQVTDIPTFPDCNEEQVEPAVGIMKRRFSLKLKDRSTKEGKKVNGNKKEEKKAQQSNLACQTEAATSEPLVEILVTKNEAQSQTIKLPRSNQVQTDVTDDSSLDTNSILATPDNEFATKKHRSSENPTEIVASSPSVSSFDYGICNQACPFPNFHKNALMHDSAADGCITDCAKAPEVNVEVEGASRGAAENDKNDVDKCSLVERKAGFLPRVPSFRRTRSSNPHEKVINSADEVEVAIADAKDNVLLDAGRKILSNIRLKPTGSKKSQDPPSFEEAYENLKRKLKVGEHGAMTSSTKPIKLNPVVSSHIENQETIAKSATTRPIKNEQPIVNNGLLCSSLFDGSYIGGALCGGATSPGGSLAIDNFFVNAALCRVPEGIPTVVTEKSEVEASEIPEKGTASEPGSLKGNRLKARLGMISQRIRRQTDSEAVAAEGGGTIKSENAQDHHDSSQQKTTGLLSRTTLLKRPLFKGGPADHPESTSKDTKGEIITESDSRSKNDSKTAAPEENKMQKDGTRRSRSLSRDHSNLGKEEKQKKLKEFELAIERRLELDKALLKAVKVRMQENPQQRRHNSKLPETLLDVIEKRFDINATCNTDDIENRDSLLELDTAPTLTLAGTIGNLLSCRPGGVLALDCENDTRTREV